MTRAPPRQRPAPAPRTVVPAHAQKRKPPIAGLVIAIPTEFLGGSASSKGPVKTLFGLSQPGRECPQAATGARYKKMLSQKWVAQVFPPVPIGLWVGVVVFIPRIYPPLAIPPCHRPFLFSGARQVRSRGKVLVGLGNGRATNFFVCAKSAAVEKNVPSMGALSAAPASLGPSAQNLESKSPFPRPRWAVVTTAWHHVVGGRFCRVALLLQERPIAHAGSHRRPLL
jgi:hypothetical protein